MSIGNCHIVIRKTKDNVITEFNLHYVHVCCGKNIHT